MKIISFEDLCNLEKNWYNIDVKNESIFNEANNNSRCEFLVEENSCPPSIAILIKDNTISDDVLGYMVVVAYDDISVWLAKDFRGNVSDGVAVCSLNRNSSLNNVISKCDSEINTCPICKKSVPYKEQNRFSFAGRCCKDCLPKMRAEHEKPGWYN